MKPDSALLAWLSSFRLKTLPLAISAILIGSALAYWQHTFSWSIFLFTLLTACLLQILSNLANDYGDGLKGNDSINRIGPKRGIHRGDITLRQLLIALMINTMLCAISGLCLLFVACDTGQQLIVFIGIGILSIIAAITYTVGKNPYGYIGLGDISVLIFFGCVSVLGSFYLQHKSLSLSFMLPACGSGLLSVAVLNINNLRDYQSDKVNHKKTLVVIIGIKWAKYYHIALLTFSYLLLSLFSWCYLNNISGWLFLVTLPLCIYHLKAVFIARNHHDFIVQFVPMIRLALIVNILYSLGIILS